MNPLAIIPKRLLIELGALALLGFALYLENGWREDWKAQFQVLHASEVAAAKVHKGELHVAHDTHDSEVATDRRDAGLAPVVLRLRLNAPTVLAGSSTCPDTSAAGRSLQPVPSGDPGSGAGREGPDIGGMLSALALRADLVSADLREQQAVK